VTTTIKGKFGWDPRAGWTPIDAGYSPDEQGHPLSASPAVELLAAVGLEHARLDGYETRNVRYVVWGKPLPPILARVAISRPEMNVPSRQFQFELRLISNKYKVTTYAHEETQT
jgi:CRISPR-associated protein Csx14